jgi:hypothetical protein
MAHALLEPEYLAKLSNQIYDEDIQAFVSASRQIENRLCTSRESLLGSGAWKQVRLVYKSYSIFDTS